MIATRSAWCGTMLLVTVTGLRAAFPAYASPAGGVEAAIERGDHSYARGQLNEALSAYHAAVAEQAESYSGLCGLARVESELAEVAPGEERRRLIASAVEHARAAIKASPDRAQGHVWLAVALGQEGEMEGPKTRAALWREIKSELDRAIAADPSIARAYLERGRW